MAWRKPVRPARIEPPVWYRFYDPGAWDDPDGHEQSMIDGCTAVRCWPGAPDSAWPNWPQWLHDHHARRRWEQAKGAYRDQHPQLAAQEFADIGARRATRRAAQHAE